MNFKHILGLTAATLILNVSFLADASAASIRLTCETKGTRSKISVDGNDLATGKYRAKVKSGANVKTSPFKPTIGDEVEFDFDSATEAGAVKIIAGFIKNAEVTAWIYDEDNFVVATTTAPCKVK
ncbi:MAG: hypothetical protein ACXW1W_19000 [Methylococcaceae bacterium]